MGRRSRKRYKRPVRRVRRLPKIFQCPACGLPMLTVELKEYSVIDETLGGEVTRKNAFIKCLNPECGLRSELKDLPGILEAVDAYAKFLDAFNEGRVEVWFEKGGEGVEGEGR